MTHEAEPREAVGEFALHLSRLMDLINYTFDLPSFHDLSSAEIRRIDGVFRHSLEPAVRKLADSLPRDRNGRRVARGCAVSLEAVGNEVRWLMDEVEGRAPIPYGYGILAGTEDLFRIFRRELVPAIDEAVRSLSKNRM